MRRNFFVLLHALAAFLLSPLSAAEPAAGPLAAFASAGWAAPLSGPVYVPEARTPSPVHPKGNFSQVPDFAFAYLNDLNTKLIDGAARTVDVCMYSVTLADNPDALLRAVQRGVKVRVIMDEKHVFPKAEDQTRRLMNAPGVEFRTLRGTRAWGVNHNKIVLGDGEIAAVGSYNWTFGATFSNFENTMVARNPVYVNGYRNYFEWMWSRARPLAQGPAPAELPDGYYGLPPQDPAPAQVFNGLPVPAYLFSPGSRTEERLAALIDAARSSLDAVTFTFSSQVLADAVARAQKRGVKVRFMMDRNMAADSPLAKQVLDSGAQFRWRIGRTDKGALHDKFAILDGKLLETGSFNWTSNASVNSFENVILVTDPAALKAYQAAYDNLWNGAEVPPASAFEGADRGPAPAGLAAS